MIHVFNGFIVVYAAFLAVSADNILDTGQKIGTSSNQVLLGGLVVVLILVVIYLGRKQDKANKSAEERQIKLDAKIDAERAAFGEERRSRIEALMRMVTDNSVALNRTASAELSMGVSVDALKLTVHGNTEVTKELLALLRRQNGKMT